MTVSYKYKLVDLRSCKGNLVLWALGCKTIHNYRLYYLPEILHNHSDLSIVYRYL
jgi:hypothetical protein